MIFESFPNCLQADYYRSRGSGTVFRSLWNNRNWHVIRPKVQWYYITTTTTLITTSQQSDTQQLTTKVVEVVIVFQKNQCDKRQRIAKANGCVKRRTRSHIIGITMA
jgi:hypothetical protein